MLSLPPALAILAFTAFTVVATPASIPLYIKAGIVPGRTIPKGGDDAPITPPSYHTPYDSPTGTYPGSWIGDTGHPSPPTADEIEYAPAPQKNNCFSSEKCKEVIEVAADVIEKIIDAVSGAGGSSTTTSSFASMPTYSYPNSTGPQLSKLIPNGDMAITLANADVEDEYLGLLSQDEQDLFVDSPVCFFANMERMYAAAASSATTTSLPDRAKAKRDDPLGYIQSCEDSGCPESTSTLSSGEVGALQTAFFQDALPSRLRSIYAAATSTGMETATTTCSAFDDGTTYTTSFVQRAVATATAASIATSSPVSEATHDMPIHAGAAFFLALGLWG